MPRLLQRRGLRPHYPSEAALLESSAGYRRPPPLAPLGAGLLGLLLAPLDHWGQRQQRLERRGEKRRQNPAYSRLLYLRRRLWAEGWLAVPPPSPFWRPRPEEVGLNRQQLQRQLRSTPSRDPRDPSFRRHLYLRHGSLLLLGVVAPPAQAKLWSRRLVEQLAALGLPGQKPPRPRSSSQPFFFRGFRLRCPGLQSSSPSGGAPVGGLSPRSSPRLSLKLPTARLCALLGRRGLLRWGGEGLHPADAELGRSPGGWQSGGQPALLRWSTPRLLRLFAAAQASTVFYYRGVDNPRELLLLLRRLRGTLLRSLALRYRLAPGDLERRWSTGFPEPSRRRCGGGPPLPPLPDPALLASSRPVAQHGRRWQDSRLGLSLEPLLRLSGLAKAGNSARRRRSGGGGTVAAAEEPPLRPSLGRLRRLPRGAPARLNPEDPPLRRP